jgi:hypothetical protein
VLIRAWFLAAPLKPSVGRLSLERLEEPMRKAQVFLISCCLLLCGGLVAQAQKVKTSKPEKQNNAAAIEREIRGFFDSYAEHLRQHRREAIANSYDSRGYYRLGNGEKTLVSFEDAKTHYLTKWTGPRSFEWKDLSIEILSPDTAVVVGLFEWQTASGQMRSFSYTGLLIKHSGRWRIRVEDESPLPFNPVTPILGDSSQAGPFKYLYTSLPGTSIAAHRHSVDLKTTVRSGRTFLLMGDLNTARVQIVEAGATVVIPANVWHLEWWETETIEEKEGIGPMKTERATPSTPRIP